MGPGMRAGAARRVVGLVVAVALGPIAPLALTGCAATQSGSAMLESALGDYRAQRFSRAKEQAERVSAGSAGTLRGRAEYLAGVSAYKLGDHDEARRRLTAAVSTLDGEDAATARAALGLVELARDRPVPAAEAFAAAWPGLAGEDARQAAFHAVHAYEQAGNHAAAAEWARSPHDRRSPSAAGRGFTIQVGAFRDRLRAERAAVDATRITREMGLAPVRIVTRNDRRGGVLYVVQLGYFGTRTEASDVRQRVGKLQYIVAARTPG